MGQVIRFISARDRIVEALLHDDAEMTRDQAEALIEEAAQHAAAFGL